MTIYEKIKNRRIELDMSQEDLALKVGFQSRSAISKIEKGKRKIDTEMLPIFAKALSTTVSSLIDDVPMERTTPQPDNSLKEYKVVAMNGVPGTHTATVDSEKAEKIAELVESAANLTPGQIEKLIKMSKII